MHVKKSFTKAFALSGATLLVAAGCATGTGVEVEASNVGEVATDTSATVRILMEAVPDTDIVQGLVAEFNAVYPDITIEIESLAFDQMRDKLIASFQSSEPTYDLIVADNPWMDDFAPAGFLEPLDERIANTPDFDHEDFFGPLREITDVGGVTYGVPFYNYALGYLYNEQALADAGVSVPTSLDELVTSSATLTADGKTGLAMQPQRGYKIFEEWANFLFAAGGSIYNEDGSGALDSPEAAAALEAYIELYNNSAPENSLNWAFDEAFRSVSTGESAAMVSYNWNLPRLNSDEAGDLAGNFKLAPMPGGKQVLGSWSWAIPTNSAEADAAWAFVSWMTSKDVDVQRMIAGGAAIRESTLKNESVLAEGFGADYYEAIIAILSNAAPLSEGTGGEEMIQAVGTELSEAVAGTKSVADALKAANDAINEIQG
jgi:ABC-type glycerol-3-phosphate transport system substrate-binding protein